jgi:plastocyanin
MASRISVANKRWLAVAALMTAVVGLGGCGDDDGDTATSDTTSAAATTDGTGDAGATTTGPAGVEGTEVTIEGYEFAPPTLVANVGDTVVWTNLDDFAHRSTSDDDLWGSEDIEGDGTFEFTFEEAGTFAYHCGIHNYMKGSIVVEEA